jgi:hypothetical protein
MSVDRAKLGKRNKNMGSNAERLYANLFREIGFNFCKTSRQASRIHDDAGIDLTETHPFNVQVKAGMQKGMNHSNVLSIIKERCVELFSPDNIVHKNINIMIHKKVVGKGRKRNEFDDLVTMSFEDFKKLVNRIKWD